ncbi:MAG TPA: YgiT-type zinc finger protein [Anaerolineae bacterium]|nr:YgiT-type zinc finger protein [Anaerolineae bacterium]
MNETERNAEVRRWLRDCGYCSGDLVEQLTTFVHEDDNQFWIVRNVPAFVCTRCGEKEYTQETTRRVLSLLKQPSWQREIWNTKARRTAKAKSAKNTKGNERRRTRLLARQELRAGSFATSRLATSRPFAPS